MLTKVFKEILDKSISGDKIFGGTINWIDGLYTDKLVVPHAGNDGTGSINGRNFRIGNYEKIGLVGAVNISARNILGVANDDGWTGFMKNLGTGSETVYLRGTEIWSTFGSGSLSYTMGKFLVGKNDEEYPGYFLEATSGMIGTLTSNKFSSIYSNIGLAFADDGMGVSTDLAEIIDMVKNITDILGVGGLIGTPWTQLKNLSAAGANRLLPVNDFNIVANNWNYLESLDQNVGINSWPYFEAVALGPESTSMRPFSNVINLVRSWVDIPVKAYAKKVAGNSNVGNTFAQPQNLMMDIEQIGRRVTIIVRNKTAVGGQGRINWDLYAAPSEIATWELTISPTSATMEQEYKSAMLPLIAPNFAPSLGIPHKVRYWAIGATPPFQIQHIAIFPPEISNIIFAIRISGPQWMHENPTLDTIADVFKWPTIVPETRVTIPDFSITYLVGE